MCILAAYGVAPEVIIGSKPVDRGYERPASIRPLPLPLSAEPSAVDDGPPQAERLAVMAAAAPMVPVYRRKVRRSTPAGLSSGTGPPGTSKVEREGDLAGKPGAGRRIAGDQEPWASDVRCLMP